MSLYNNVRTSIAQGFGVSRLLQTLGAPRLPSALTNAADMLVRKQTGKYLPKLNQAMGLLDPFVNGGGIEGILNYFAGGAYRQTVGYAGKDAEAWERFRKAVNPLMGGITPDEARRIYDEAQNGGHVRKNLFLLNVSSPLGGEAQAFNLFATDVEFSPFIVSGEKMKVGGAVLDRAEGCEAVEMTITTYDDRAGTLKKWFSDHHAAIAHADGTLGVPADYAVTIWILHGFITEENSSSGWTDKGLFRPASLQTTLSRRDQGLEELQMTFSQMDTFMS
jgi:hypothetical protein